MHSRTCPCYRQVCAQLRTRHIGIDLGVTTAALSATWAIRPATVAAVRRGADRVALRLRQ